MAEYVSIREFAQGWNYFTKKIKVIVPQYGKFPCSDFSCSDCDDWLDCDSQNRNVKIQKFYDIL